jgi:preprotein translocase subunit SecG
MLYYLAATVYAFICLLLLLVVLLQQGRGGAIASAFGGGSSQTTFGARQGATVLSRATSVLGALFMIGSLALAAWGQRGPSSVVGGFREPARRPAPAAPAQPGNQPAATPGQAAPATPSQPAAPAGQTPPPAGSSTPEQK